MGRRGGVWVAESPDLPGLILEVGSQDLLMEKILQVVPELLADTDFARPGHPDVAVRVVSEAARFVHVAP